MGRLAEVERGIWQMLTGSSHENYRQVRWRFSPQRADSVPAWSDGYDGDRQVGGVNRHSWQKIGVLTVRNGELEELMQQHNSQPVLAFPTVFGRLAIGKLEGDKDLGFVGVEEQARAGHGFRIGNGDTRFSIGVVDTNGLFIPPHPDNLDSQGPIWEDQVGVKGSGYEHLHFS